MGSEKFCLRWNDFENNISSSFRELRDDKDFFDVTLACDDDQIQAHKVILASCSQFFRIILRRNPHQHPLLYLKGVKFNDLQSILTFMYHGEVNVAQEDLNSFLSVAEDLRIKGLTQNSSKQEKREEIHRTRSPPLRVKPSPRYVEKEPPPSRRPLSSNVTTGVSMMNNDDDIQEVVPVKSEPKDSTAPVPQNQSVVLQDQMYSTQPQTTNQTLAPVDDQLVEYHDESFEDYGDYQGYDGSVVEGQTFDGAKGQFGDPSDLFQFVIENFDGGKRFHCGLCNKFAHSGKTHVRNHVESVHYPNSFLYPCDQCDKSFPSKQNYQLHKSRVHKQKNNAL